MSGKKKCFLTVMLVVGMESLLSGCGTGTSVNDTVAQTNDSLTIYVLDRGFIIRNKRREERL